MLQVEDNTLDDLTAVTGIPIVLTDRMGNVFACYPKEHDGIYNAAFLTKLSHSVDHCRHPDGVLLSCVGEMYYVAAVKLEDDCYLVTAPVSSSAHGNTISLPFAQSIISSGKLLDLYSSLANIPALNIYQLARLCRLIKQLCSGRTTSGICIQNAYGSEQPEETYEPEPTTVEPVTISQQKHISVHFERSVSEAIKAGDEALLLQALERPKTGYIGRMSVNDLRQRKYSFICTMFYASRAAIQGGLPPEISFQMSDNYCQRMDAMELSAEIEALSRTACIDYCKKVAKAKGHRMYSVSTRISCEYIMEHLYDNFGINDLVAAAHLNRRSLSIYFNRDTQMSIPEYINDRRLDEAKYLLANSHMPLSQISQLLQFSSQSYFGKKYRDRYSITPQQYRDQLAAGR